MKNLSEINNEIDNISFDFNTEFGNLSGEQLHVKLDNNSWSIYQVIDHIIIINSSYFEIFDQLQNNTYKAPFLSKIGFLGPLFGKMILNSVKPEEKKKTRTFPIWEPAKSSTEENIINRLLQHHEELKTKLKQIEEQIASGQIIHSPANKNIFYPLPILTEILINHEKRHFLQAKRVLEKIR